MQLTASNLVQPTEDVIRWLAGGIRNAQATAVLDGLELLDGEKLKPHQSRYAKVVLEKLASKPPGQVVNRKELMTVKNDMERETRYQLEPELLLIVLLSLVQNGNITLSLTGKKLDAASLGEAAKMPLDQLLAFKHVEKPKGLPLAELVALFELLGLAEGLIRNENNHEEAVRQLRAKASELTEKVVTVAQYVQTGLPCWGSELIPAEEREQQRQKLDGLKDFLEGLQAFNIPGKLKNFSKTVMEIQFQAANLELIKQLEDLHSLVQELTPLTSYLATAAVVLPPQDPWRAQMETIRSEWSAKLLDPAARGAADFRQKINRALTKAKDDYRTAYFNLHKKARLGVNEDAKKKELMKDSRLESLKKLAASVSLLPHASLSDLQTRLANLKPCFTLVKDDLNALPTCPHCSFRPQEEAVGVSAATVLQQIDEQLDTLLENWRKTLLENLDDPTTAGLDQRREYRIAKTFMNLLVLAVSPPCLFQGVDGGAARFQLGFLGGEAAKVGAGIERGMVCRDLIAAIDGLTIEGRPLGVHRGTSGGRVGNPRFQRGDVFGKAGRIEEERNQVLHQIALRWCGGRRFGGIQIVVRLHRGPLLELRVAEFLPKIEGKRRFAGMADAAPVGLVARQFLLKICNTSRRLFDDIAARCDGSFAMFKLGRHSRDVCAVSRLPCVVRSLKRGGGVLQFDNP